MWALLFLFILESVSASVDTANTGIEAAILNHAWHHIMRLASFYKEIVFTPKVEASSMLEHRFLFCFSIEITFTH